MMSQGIPAWTQACHTERSKQKDGIGCLMWWDTASLGAFLYFHYQQRRDNRKQRIPSWTEPSQYLSPNHRGAPILSCKIPNLEIYLLSTATPPVQGESETIPADFSWKVGYTLSVTGLTHRDNHSRSCVNQHVLFTMVESHSPWEKKPFQPCETHKLKTLLQPGCKY